MIPTIQGQFTPLPEALCDVIMDLTAQGQSATMENIRIKLTHRYENLFNFLSPVLNPILILHMAHQQVPSHARPLIGDNLRRPGPTEPGTEDLSDG